MTVTSVAAPTIGMIPKSLSATAMDVATKCLARYAAENYNKADRGESGDAALLGSSCHNALEDYVRDVYMLKKAEPDLVLLLMYYQVHFMELFGTAEASGEMYQDGVDMLTAWHERTNFEGVEVLSVESKENFPIRVKDAAGTQHTIPFNYLFDRLDRLDEDTIRVVDYKTVRWGYGPDELRLKLQARAYAVAAQIKFPQAKRIWVVFDLLRHDPVGTVFTQEENRNTYKYMRKWARTILDTKPDKAPETVNGECKFCIRKTVCQELSKNRAAGGVVGLPVSVLVDRRAVIQDQIAGLKSLADELDAQLKVVAEQDDLMVLSSEANEVFWARSSRRGVSRVDALEKILGPELMERVGKKDVSVTKLDALLKPKATELTADQKKKVKALIGSTSGEPYVKTRPTNKIDPKP